MPVNPIVEMNAKANGTQAPGYVGLRVHLHDGNPPTSVTKFLNDQLGFDLYRTGFKLYSFWGLVIVPALLPDPAHGPRHRPRARRASRRVAGGGDELGRVAGAVLAPRRPCRCCSHPCSARDFPVAGGSPFGAYATAYALTWAAALVPLLIGSVTQGNVLSNPHYGGLALALGMVLVLTVTMTGYAILQRKASRWQR